MPEITQLSAMRSLVSVRNLPRRGGIRKGLTCVFIAIPHFSLTLIAIRKLFSMPETTLTSALQHVAGVLGSSGYAGSEVFIIIPHILLEREAARQKVSFKFWFRWRFLSSV